MKLAIAEAWRFAETQECVSTGGRVFVFCAASLANQAWRFRDSRHLECAGHIREFDEKL